MDSPELIKRRRNIVLIWSVVLTVVTLLLIGGFMMFWLKGHGRSVEVVEAAPQLENVRISSKFASPSEADALDLVKRALQSRDKQSVQARFHLGGASAEEVIEFIKGLDHQDGGLERMDWLSSMDVGDLLMEGVLVVFKGRQNTPSERVAFLVPDDMGVWKVDFDAFARSSRPSWKEILKGEADHSQVRVFVAQDSYFNGPFLDESKWSCYAMFSPETKAILPEDHEILRGYCKLDSPQAKAMQRIFTGESRIGRVTLEIRKVEGADSRQFEITRVLAEDWVMPARPFDEKFD